MMRRMTDHELQCLHRPNIHANCQYTHAIEAHGFVVVGRDDMQDRYDDIVAILSSAVPAGLGEMTDCGDEYLVVLSDDMVSVLGGDMYVPRPRTVWLHMAFAVYRFFHPHLSLALLRRDQQKAIELLARLPADDRRTLMIAQYWAVSPIPMTLHDALIHVSHTFPGVDKPSPVRVSEREHYAPQEMDDADNIRHRMILEGVRKVVDVVAELIDSEVRQGHAIAGVTPR